MISDLFLCSRTSSLRESMKKIDRNGICAIFAVDEENRLCGVLTDGDIRRALLGGVGLNDEISMIIKNDYIFVRDSDDYDKVTSMFSNSVRVIPVVDDDMHLVDYLEFNESLHLSLAEPQLNGNEYRYLMEAFLSSWISSAGKYIEAFERSFSSYCGVRYGVATSNGTTALHLALVALGIGPGDEVIVPNLTFAATINSVIYTGATPVIVDIERDSWCMDPKKFCAAITDKTKAVIPVHLYGQPCDMGGICKIARENHIFVIEDCAEAHGAKWSGKRVGSFGDISCFSFYGNKVITTGEGGMCVTNDPNLDGRMRLFRDHGMNKDRRYYHEVVGFNYRMTNLQAAIGVAQVEHIEDILQWRKDLEDTYRRKMKNDECIVLQRNDLRNRDKISWLVSVLVEADKRDKIIDSLKLNNIDVRPFFVPLSQMDIYKKYVRTKCPVSCEISERGINLPTTYELKEDMVDRIVGIIREVI